MRAAVQLAGAPAAQFSAVVPDAHNEAAAVRQRLSLVCLQDPVERGQAEQMLRVFGQSTDYVSHCKVRRCVCSPASPGNAGTATTCLAQDAEQASARRAQAILDNSTSAYAQLLASASLIRVVTEHTLR